MLCEPIYYLQNTELSPKQNTFKKTGRIIPISPQLYTTQKIITEIVFIKMHIFAYFVYIFLLTRIKCKTQNWCRPFRSQKYRKNIYQFRPFFHHFFGAKKSSNGPVSWQANVRTRVRERCELSGLGAVR